MEKLEFKIKNELFTIWHFRGPPTGPVMHWAHANGFNGPTYHFLLESLSKHCTVYAWDARKHGGTQGVSKPVKEKIFQTYSNDLQSVIETLYRRHEKPIILAGHSFGASLCVGVESQLQGKISRLILCDPVLFTPLYSWLSVLGRFLKLKKPREIYFAQNALKRRNLWNNFDEIYDSYQGRNLFKKWDHVSLKNYIKFGTQRFGHKLQLSCHPEIESMIFSQCEKEFMSKRIRNLSTSTSLFLAQKGSPAFAKSVFAACNTKVDIIMMNDSSHFFPVENYKALNKQIIKYISAPNDLYN